MTPAPRPRAPGAACTGEGERIWSVDFAWKGKDYRLAEPGRDQGSTVRYAQDGAHCQRCFRPVRASGYGVRLADRQTWLHVPCAIQMGVLAAMKARGR
jgi:hypothetical protein